ncbi:MAG: hypothetical protein ACK5MJ_07520 [Alphaproteobacteria bacterium]
MVRIIFLIFLFALNSIAAQANTIKGICIDIGRECEILNSLAKEYQQDASHNLKEDIVFTPKSQRWIRDILPLNLKAGEDYDMAVTTTPFSLYDWYLDISPYVERSFFYSQYGDTQSWIIHDANDSRLVGFSMGINFAHLYIRSDHLKIDSPNNLYWKDFLEQSKQTAFEHFAENNILINPNGALWADIAMTYGINFIDGHGNFNLSTFQFRNFLTDILLWKKQSLFSLGNWNLMARSHTNKQLFLDGKTESLYTSGFYYGDFLYKENMPFLWDAISPLCGTKDCVAIPEQHSLIGISTTQYPKQVAKFIQWLAQPEQQLRYAKATLSLPANQSLQQSSDLYKGLNAQEKQHLQHLKKQYDNIPQNALLLVKSPKNVIFYNTLLRQIRAILPVLPLSEVLDSLKNEFNRRSTPYQ